MSQLYYILLFIYISVSFLGYGLFVGSLAYRRTIDIGFAVALGTAVFIAIGGGLNAVSAIGPRSVDFCLAMGVVLLIGMLFMRGAAIKAEFWSFIKEPAFLASLAIFAFTVRFAAPSYYFNPGDDLAQYITRPFGMLLFGNAAWNPFDSTGADSLGAQFWLLATVVRYLDFTYVPAFNLFLMQFLCCLVIISIARTVNTSRLITLAAVCLFVILYPAIVNVSSVYSTSLMVGCLTLTSLCAFGPAADHKNSETGWGRSLPFFPIGIALGALIALKMTTVPFAALFSLLLLCVSPMAFSSVAVFSRALVVVVVFTIVVILAWALPFLPLYREALSLPGSTSRDCDGFIECWYSLFKDTNWFFWFSTIRVEYGIIGVAQTLCCLLALLAGTRELLSRRNFGLVAVCYAAALYYIAAPGIFPWAYLRYSAPVMNMAASIAFLVIAAPIRKTDARTRPGNNLLRYPVAAIAWLSAVLIVVNMNASLQTRVQGALDPAGLYKLHSANVRYMFAKYAKEIAALQAAVPEGKTILIGAIPVMGFDMVRNRILSVHPAGLTSKWWPDMGQYDRDKMRETLQAKGIEYIILQTDEGPWKITDDNNLKYAGSRQWITQKASRNFWAIYRLAKYGGLGKLEHDGKSFILVKLDAECDGGICPRSPSPFQPSLGSEVRISEQLKPPAHLRTGWKAPDAKGVWAFGNSADMRFDLAEPPARPLRLRVTLARWPDPAQPTRKIRITAFGSPLGSWNVGAKSQAYCIDLPPSAFLNATVMLNFDFQNSSKDKSQLGMYLQAYTLEDGTCSNLK